MSLYATGLSSYHLVVTEPTNGCSNFTDVNINTTICSTCTTDAGNSFSMGCINNFAGGVATLNATGSGQWTPSATNTGTATIASLTAPNTSIYNFSGQGIYTFIWTSPAGCSDEVTVDVPYYDYGNLNPITWPVADASVPAANAAWLGNGYPTNECSTSTADPADGMAITDQVDPVPGLGTPVMPFSLNLNDPSGTTQFDLNLSLNSSTSQTVYWGAWVDADSDGDFTGPADVFISGSKLAHSLVQDVATIGITKSLLNGITLGKIRVIAVGGSDPGFSQAMNGTGSFTNGEVEDYYLQYPTSLPVQLLSFIAQKAESAVVLNWKVAAGSIQNNFVVERSANGTNWQTIGNVKANTNQQLYSFTDVLPSTGANYYRLMQVAGNGKKEYSMIHLINFGSSAIIAAYPNPVTNQLNITGLSIQDRVALKDISGRTLMTITASATTEQLKMSQLAAGTYLLQITGKVGNTSTIKVFKKQ